MTIAVVGHVEYTEFAPVERLPRPGEIIEAHGAWQQAAGGAAVAAVQIAKLTGGCLFFTALGDDELGRRAASELEAMGVELAVAWRPEPQRRAFVFLDDAGERTITVIGDAARAAGHGRAPLAQARRSRRRLLHRRRRRRPAPRRGGPPGRGAPCARARRSRGRAWRSTRS